MALSALPVMKWASMFSTESADSRCEYSLAATPTKTPVRLPRNAAGEYPARSRPSQASFEHQPLLRIDPDGLARGNAEELRIESVDLVEESAAAGVDLARRLRIRVVELVDVEAVLGDLPDRIDTAGQHLPESFGIGRARESGTPPRRSRSARPCVSSPPRPAGPRAVPMPAR